MDFIFTIHLWKDTDIIVALIATAVNAAYTFFLKNGNCAIGSHSWCQAIQKIF